MNSYKTTTEMKTAARGLLLGKYGIYIAALAIVTSIVYIVTMIVSMALPTDTIWGTILNFAITLIIDLIAAVFSLGLIRFTLNICRNQPYKLSDLLYGFSTHPDKAIICRFLFTVAEIVCMLPALLFMLLYSITEKDILTLVIALLLVIGGFGIVVLHLTYDFVYYTMLDYPDATLKQLFTYCAEVMRGHRVKFFYLQASFLPLLVLSLLSFGIGFLFVIPYQNVAIAQFYLDVFHPQETLIG